MKRDEMHLTVQMALAKDTFSITVTKSTTIDAVKNEICKKCGLRQSAKKTIKLYFDNEPLFNKEDSCTMEDLNIQDNDILTMDDVEKEVEMALVKNPANLPNVCTLFGAATLINYVRADDRIAELSLLEWTMANGVHPKMFVHASVLGKMNRVFKNDETIVVKIEWLPWLFLSLLQQEQLKQKKINAKNDCKKTKNKLHSNKWISKII